MKKNFATLISLVLIAILASISVFAAYPASVEWDHPLPTNGKLLIGEMSGTPAWGESVDNTFDKAWDGDEDTFFDPEAVGEEYYTCMKLDQAYILTEIRILPRSGQEGRWVGATVQGSNDGENWTDIFLNMDTLDGYDYQIITPDLFESESNTGYIYYRYVNNTSHGDVAEVELYGNPSNTAVPTPVETPKEEAPAEAPAPAPAPATGDFTLIVVCAALAALVATVTLRKKAVK